jgi:tripartite-type tricarboxylate transporter receptor subunit TctC
MRKLLLAALLVLPLFASAQYPAKPLRAIVAFGTGGTTDVTARIIAAALSQSLGQPVVIDNKPGADGIIAGSEVVKSAPDGYTIFFGTYTQVSALPSLRKNVPFDPLVDLTPIGCIGNFTFFWAVNPELPIKNMKELAAYGRANPGKLNAGSSGAAATMAPTMFARAEKFDLQVVNYKSETTALNDLVGGRIQLMLVSGTLAQHVREGRARGLATLGNQRSPAIPELPTMAESGVAPFQAVPWMGLFGPAKMPREIVERLSRELLAVLKNPEVRERVERQAIELNPLAPDAIAALAKEQTEVWRRITQEAAYIPQ